MWHPAFFHGTQAIAYELWEQIGGCAPEWVVAPVGHGTLLLGLALGFRANSRPAGAIPRLPRLVAHRAASCAPLAGPSLGLPAGVGDTIAEGIRVHRPAWGPEIARAVGGGTVGGRRGSRDPGATGTP
jgi:threonine synthase